MFYFDASKRSNSLNRGSHETIEYWQSASRFEENMEVLSAVFICEGN